MGFIRDFSELGKNDVAIAGGKGASLGEMTRAGIPVPPGFVILSPAFEKFLNDTDLNVEIDSILHAVNHEEIHTVDSASEQIHALILGVEMPMSVGEEIQQFFNALGVKYVAVRSSATTEDSASAAWAGQLESYLNTTEVSLLENVKKCWASLFTPRAIFYRFENALHEQKISVAVVVQKMVDSEKSGVAFSVHPVTQDRNQLIVEAGFGLGEAVVSGQITPDSYVVEKEPRRIVDKNIHAQLRGLYRAESGGNEWLDIPKEQGEAQVLTDGQILALSDIVLRIESHYSFPVDVEWALEQARFYILQSRPITTLDLEGHKLARIFKKFFTRSFPLALIEYWHKGEYEVLYRMLQGAMRLNPLFIRDETGRVSVYYDINNNDTDPRRLVDFVLKNPKDFFRLADEYEKNHKRFLELIKKPDYRNLQSVFDVLAELWGFMPALVQIGELKESALDRGIIKRASHLRVKSQEKAAQAENFFHTIIKTQFPEHGSFWDVLRAPEVLSGALASVDELKKRQRGFTFFEQHLIFNRSRNEFEKEFLVEIDDSIQVIGQNAQLGKIEDSSAVTVRGNVAYPGLVRGRVRTVLSKDKIGTVQEGEILVTAMTTPEFMPAIKKVAAFITDEGGITSHAAIVARELRKPCIIGTKSATQVLRDGDLVEVDANAGVVTVL